LTPDGWGMHPRSGDRIQPMAELTFEVVEIAEGAAEEEVLADLSERPLDLAVGLGPIGPVGARLEAVMASEIDERAVWTTSPSASAPRTAAFIRS
jgi:hypothetical protein